METYLEIKNIEHRNAIRDIRISTHKLAIETGRYNNVDKESRTCEYCSMGKVESEEHFLLECPLYQDTRISFFKSLKCNVGTNTERIKIIKLIFEQGDLMTLNKLGKFIKMCINAKRVESRYKVVLLNPPPLTPLP